jgi:hypothetical protein
LMILYDYSMCPVTGKTPDIRNNGELMGNAKSSLINRSVIGRQLDFSASSVICAPLSSSAETVDDFAKFGTVQIPLQTFMAMAKPFFLNYCHDRLEKVSQALVANEHGSIKRIDNTQWSLTTIDRRITRFIKSAADASTPICLEYTAADGSKKRHYRFITELDSKTGKKITRPMVYLDLFYQAAIAVSKDKYCLNTRYPVANNQNTYVAKANVQSTLRTRDITIVGAGDIGDEGSVRYRHYPYIKYDGISKIPDETKKAMVAAGITVKDPNPKGESYYDFQRASVVGNGHIKSLGADYDGDVLFFRCLFTKEANAEAEKMIWNKANWFGASGNLTRGITKITKDVTLSLYQLTKD